MLSFSAAASAASRRRSKCATRSARRHHQVTVVSDLPNFQFTPSNPWLAVNWRKPEELKVPLAPVFKKKNIGFTDVGAKRVHPAENRIELNNGESLTYDYLVIATGPKLAFERNSGPWPAWRQHAFDLHAAARRARLESLGRILQGPGPDRHRRRAGRLLLRPGL